MMSRMVVQIYSMTSPEEAAMVSSLGADHVGMMVWLKKTHFPILSIKRAKRIAREVAGGSKVVIIPTTHNLDEIIEIVENVAPDYVQIASYQSYMDFNSFILLSEKLRSGGAKVIKVIPVNGYKSIEMALLYERCCDVIMTDSAGKPPFPHARGFIGGTGKTHNWKVSAEIRKRIKKPLILAGGLSPENVRTAIKEVFPWGVDAASSLNFVGTYKKDPRKVKAFIEAVRSIEGDL